MHQGQPGIVVGHPRFKHTRNGEAAQLGSEVQSTAGLSGDQHRDGAAHLHTELVCQGNAKNDAVQPRLQQVQLAFQQGARRGGNRGLAGRIDAAHQCSGHLGTIRQQGLLFDERRSPAHWQAGSPQTVHHR